jgi:segregation and condensation protein A
MYPGGGSGFVVELEKFSGPLDLLLHLIREDEVDVTDLPIAKIADQFLSVINDLGLNQAADYLEMAARLLRIKAQMLLPRRLGDDEWEDPRAELVRRLLEYEQTKLQAASLSAMPQAGRDFWKAQVYIEQSLKPRFPDMNVVDLRDAWADILKRAKLVQHHKISREELSVREHMSIVLRHLQGRQFVEFEKLFDVTRGTPVLIVTFIAMLELAKETLIDITQAEAFAPIYVRLAYAPA